MKKRIMYIENKAGGLSGAARIGRVSFSRTGATVYYQGKAFQSLKGKGFKANYFEEESGDHYWISGPKKNGRDRLYASRVPVTVDEDASVEYWSVIRKIPRSTSSTDSDRP
ncbi:1-deoxy-D-xylulose-5-phosphate synthase [Acidovorax sp. Leaf78]|uniref:1-deoxy-D-xylulose-5-phosphate synthase n=1 Tax=unclassified Acidovorax TaxID=2684926 RepID=UPI000A804AA4|nr:1-deoxy-D-xylulose-5-phosphate synthase [Acidovorax sp. Leaf78]